MPVIDSPDHPRSRGVYPGGDRGADFAAGSSPLARGLPACASRLSRPSRIIPARAGFTPPSRPRRRPWWDHPRSRGVYRPGRGASTIIPGSSPLARGLLNSGRVQAALPRIIPARAGFTRRPQEPLQALTDHPRSRGVYLGDHVPGRHPEGSSPLARGLRADAQDPGDAAGIIPARAGFTGRVHSPYGSAADHPRSRGVYWAAGADPVTPAGSSPLARGLLSIPFIVVWTLRIIPARAGFTVCGRSWETAREDHPRSRGVYLRAHHGHYAVHGSSPLARGLPASTENAVRMRGIIPARAGFTPGPY